MNSRNLQQLNIASNQNNLKQINKNMGILSNLIMQDAIQSPKSPSHFGNTNDHDQNTMYQDIVSSPGSSQVYQRIERLKYAISHKNRRA